MARKPTTRAGGGWGRRLLRYALITLAVLLFVLFCGTATLVFNPFEGGFGEVVLAVPRGIDFCLRKGQLGRDFDPFPWPACRDALQESPAWERLAGGPTLLGLERDLGFGRDPASGRPLGLVASLAQLEKDLRAAPIDLFANLAARDLAVAGILQGRSLDRASLCAYARVRWKVKAALGLLKYGFTHRFLPPGLTVAWQEGILEVAGLPQGRKVWLARERDLLLAGTDRELVKRSLLLARGESQEDSLGSSADYQEGARGRPAPPSPAEALAPGGLPLPEELQASLADRAAALARSRPVEVYLNTDRLFTINPGWTAWPDRRAVLDLGQRAASLFLQPRSWRRAVGALFLEDYPRGVSLAATVDVNSQQADAFLQRWLDAQAEPNERFIDGLARVAPLRTAVMAALRIQIPLLMRELYNLLEPSEKDLLLDTLRNTGRYQAVDQFIDEFFGGFLPRVGLVVRANDFPPLPDDPKSDGLPVPAVGVVLWSRSGEEERVKAFMDFLRKYSPQWGFSGVFSLPAGPGDQYEVIEFHSPQISGTGCMAVLAKKEHGRGEVELLLGNSGRLLREMLNARFREGGITPLETESSWRSHRYDLPGASSGALYVQGAELAGLMEKWLPFLQAGVGERAGFFERVRPQAESAVLRERFAGYPSRGAMPAPVQAQYDQEVRQRLDREWEEQARVVQGQAEPFLRERIDAARLVESLSLHLFCQPRQIRVRGRAVLGF